MGQSLLVSHRTQDGFRIGAHKLRPMNSRSIPPSRGGINGNITIQDCLCWCGMKDLRDDSCNRSANLRILLKSRLLIIRRYHANLIKCRTIFRFRFHEFLNLEPVICCQEGICLLFRESLEVIDSTLKFKTSGGQSYPFTCKQ